MVRLEQRMLPWGAVLTGVTQARVSLQGGYCRISTVTQKKVPLGAALTGAMST